MKFWSYIQEIPDDQAASMVIGQFESGASSLSISNFEGIRAARENTKLMIDTVIVPTILLTIMIRSEAHEYTLGKILERARAITRNPIDIPDLLSVAGKEPKGEHSFKPDTRAIRDATAHAKFTIENISGDFAIHFNNNDNTLQGYRFQKTFFRKELLHFYQDYDRMTNIYTQLLTIRLLYSFLNMNFVMQ